MPDREAMIQAVKTYCRTETEADKEGFMALFADEVVHEDPVGLAIRRGRAGLEELWDSAQSVHVELGLEQDVIVCGHEAIGIMRARVDAGAARVETGQIVDHFIFDEAGKIVSVRAFYNYD